MEQSGLFPDEHPDEGDHTFTQAPDMPEGVCTCGWITPEAVCPHCGNPLRTHAEIAIIKELLEGAVIVAIFSKLFSGGGRSKKGRAN